MDRGPGLYGSKGAQEFNSDFDAKLTNAYLSGVAIKAGEERAVKQVVSKNAKDALNKKIGTLVFEKVYGTVPSLYEQAAGEAQRHGHAERRGDRADPKSRRRASGPVP